jgi:hypothetical protein
MALFGYGRYPCQSRCTDISKSQEKQKTLLVVWLISHQEAAVTLNLAAGQTLEWQQYVAQALLALRPWC